LSGETNTLNGIFTDVDVKLLVSDKTLKYQANLRKQLGDRNPDPLRMFEQDEQSGYSSILQKYKHCDAAMIERPPGPENVEHIVNFIELLQEETPIAKRGFSTTGTSKLSTNPKMLSADYGSGAFELRFSN
jgi:hypothetical protein